MLKQKKNPKDTGKLKCHNKLWDWELKICMATSTIMQVALFVHRGCTKES